MSSLPKSAEDLRAYPAGTVLWFHKDRTAWQKYDNGNWRGTNGHFMSSDELALDGGYAMRLIGEAALGNAWAEGHESGFWNGRESAGSGEMELCGVKHAKANNPYKGSE